MTEEERKRWSDLYQRYRWMGWAPEKRLADQILDHIRWERLGEKKR